MRALPVYLLFWPAMMLLAVGNGVLREATYGPFMSELYAHQLSTVLAMLLLGAAVFMLSKYVLPASNAQAIIIGLIWLGFTLCFEFLFGRYVAGHSWTRLLQDYDLFSGRLWIILLAWVTILPLMVYKFRNLSA